MRDQGTGWDPKGPASIHRARVGARRRAARSSPTSSPARGSRGSTSTPTAASRRTRWRVRPRRGARVRRRLRRAGGVLRVPQQAPRLGDRSAAARPRLAAALVASARSGRAADPLRERILHGRGGGGAQSGPGRSSGSRHVKDAARHRGHQGGGGEVRLGDADLAAPRPDRRQGQRPRHRLFAAQRHPRRRDRRGRHRPLHRQDLGEALRGRP